MRSFIKTLYFWLMAFSVTFVLYCVCACIHVAHLFLGLPKKEAHWVHTIGGVWGRLLIALTPGWSVRLSGLENLPPPQQCLVIVANHQSMTDIFAIYYLKRQFRWMSKQSVFRLPFIGSAVRWAGYIPVERGNHQSHAIAMEAGALCLRQGVSMFFFPEGTRSQDGSVLKFKIGAFRLARDAQIPVLPLLIHGAGTMLAKGSVFPRRAQLRFQVLPVQGPPPLASDPQGYEQDLEDYAAKIRSQIIAAQQNIIA